MSKSWTVAKTEYLTAVRSKAFLIGLAITPLFWGAPWLIGRIAQRADVRDQRFAVIDEAGRLWPAIESMADARNAGEIFEKGPRGEKKQIHPRFIPSRVGLEGRSLGDVELELSDRVRRGELMGYFVIGRDVVGGDGPEGSIAYHTQTPTASALPDWFRGAVSAEVRRLRLEKSGLDPALVASISVPPFFRSMGLVERKADGATEAKEEDKVLTFGVPLGALMLMWMLVMMSAPSLLNAVIEEKLHRISELLLSSISPFQLMLGKLLGIVMLAGTLSLIYGGAAAYALYHYGYLDDIPATLFLWFAVFMMLALLMYGSIFAAIGAACSELKDAQNLMGPAMIVIMLPMFCIVPIIKSPNGTVAVVASMFPTATPMLMLFRLATSPGPPAWQVAVSVALTLGATIAAVGAGARIFRIGILSHGQSPGIGQLIRWVFSKA